MPVPFDLTVTAEQVGSYKPGHQALGGVLRSAPRASAAAGSTPGSHGSTTSSTASELDLPRVWIDRLDSGEDASLASVRLRNLEGLPEAVKNTTS